MQLEITEQERELLLKIIEGYHTELRSEIHKTEDYDYRERLKAEEEILHGLLIGLGAQMEPKI